MTNKTNNSNYQAQILIVEDSPTQALQLRFLLESNNYTVEVMPDAYKAMVWLSGNKPALVISDILMPGMNGFDLCKRIKSSEETTNIAVLLLTSLSNTDEVVEGLIAGADGFLTKPYSNDHLLSFIKKILNESEIKLQDFENKAIEFMYAGTKRLIYTDIQKVINILLNIYQGSIHQNKRLIQTQEDLRILNEQLETLVKKRTAALGEEISINTLTTKQLRDSEEKYRTIVETANEGIWKVDADLKTIFVNEKMAKMLGYSSHEMIGRSAYDFMDKEGKKIILRHLVNRMQGNSESYEHIYIRKDGTRIITFVNVTPLKDSEGKFAGSIGLLTDITGRKKVEKALTESTEKLNLALENGNIGIWEWNISANEFFFDERISKMFGLKSGKTVKSTAEFENLVHNEDKDILRKSISETLEKNLPYETVFRTKPKKGQVKYFSLKAMLSKDTDGKPIRITGVCFDVTKLQEDSRQISELNKKLVQSNKELESFAYVASHDLQEPLRMISSFTQLLAMKYNDKLDSRAKEYIQFAVEGSHRMHDLINGLLAYSRIQSKGKMFIPVDLNYILENVIKTLSITIKERGAVLKIDKLPLILADETQMNQLFQNLISNSIKFSSGSPDIYISSKTERDKYIFSVKDKGIGIEPQYYDRIFRIFQKLHNKSEYSGTGIGLSICKSIVERHNGKIWVESEPGKGSTFFFTIPKRNQ